MSQHYILLYTNKEQNVPRIVAALNPDVCTHTDSIHHKEKHRVGTLFSSESYIRAQAQSGLGVKTQKAAARQVRESAPLSFYYLDFTALLRHSLRSCHTT